MSNALREIFLAPCDSSVANALHARKFSFLCATKYSSITEI